MKYLINRLVINADQIRQVEYSEEHYSEDEQRSIQSMCCIDFGEALDKWDAVLYGVEADAFWSIYSRDAIDALNDYTAQKLT